MPRYFLANPATDPTNLYLYATDGSPGGTRSLASLGRIVVTPPGRPAFAGERSAESLLTVSGGYVYFASADPALPGLYASDGTTVIRIDTAPGVASYTNPSRVTPFTAADGTSGVLFFGAASTGAGTQLYATTGTVSGTRAIGAPIDTLPATIVQSGAKSYFTTTDLSGRVVLTSTDGSYAATVFLGGPGTAFGPPASLTPFTMPDGTKALAFAAADGPGASTFHLYVTRGVQVAGPFRGFAVPGASATALSPALTEYPTQFVASGNHVFFVGKTIDSAYNLWSTDGQHDAIPLQIGTSPGFDSISGITPFTAADGTAKVLFAGRHAGFYQMVVTDGTQAGTKAFGKVFHSPPTSFIVDGTAPVFAVADGSATTLWTLGVTELVQLDPMATSSGTSYDHPQLATPFTRSDGSQAVAFFADDQGKTPTTHLWVTDGTGAGTRALGPALHVSFPDLPVVGGTSVFFLATDDAGRKAAYRTDGATVTRLDPGPSATYTDAVGLTPYTRPDGTQGIAFIANANLAGTPSYRLYVSDGTAAGTTAITTGDGTFPYVRAEGSTLYFAKLEPNGTRDLWSYDGVAATRLGPDGYTGTVLPSAGGFSLAGPAAKVPEGNSGTAPIAFKVSRGGPAGAAATLDYSVAGTGAHPADAADFGGALPRGSVTFLAGETVKTITVALAGDAVVEPDETFTLTLGAGANVVASDITGATATATILNDDVDAPITPTTPATPATPITPATPATPTSPTPPGTSSPIIGYVNGTSGASGTVTFSAADPGGPSYLQWQYVFSGTDSLAIATSADNVFIHGGNGTDAIQVHGGTNVIDGGLGSNFLTGGSGTDTFFTDARSPGVVWNTIRNFHTGDAATLWGFAAGVSSYRWEDKPAGAPGSEGATLRANIVGGTGRTGDGIDASITFAGMSVDDAKKMAWTTGHQPAGDYLYIAAT